MLSPFLIQFKSILALAADSNGKICMTTFMKE